MRVGSVCVCVQVAVAPVGLDRRGSRGEQRPGERVREREVIVVAQAAAAQGEWQGCRYACILFQQYSSSRAYQLGLRGEREEREEVPLFGEDPAGVS